MLFFFSFRYNDDFANKINFQRLLQDFSLTVYKKMSYKIITRFLLLGNCMPVCANFSADFPRKERVYSMSVVTPSPIPHKNTYYAIKITTITTINYNFTVTRLSEIPNKK